ncbi:MAG: hypothetical protein ABIF77_05430 [bacterium]
MKLILYGIAVLVVLAVCAEILYSAYLRYQRQRLLRYWARRHRLRIRPTQDPTFREDYPMFDCLHRGQDQFASNIMTGKLHGLDITAFDYHYRRDGGKHSTEHVFSALIACSPLQLQPLSLRPETALDKVSEFLGIDDIDFESAEFSRRFYVKADDKRWAYAVLHQRAMDHLLESPEFSLQFDWGHVIAWRPRQFDAADFDDAARVIKGLVDLLPEYLKDRQAELTWR